MKEISACHHSAAVVEHTTIFYMYFIKRQSNLGHSMDSGDKTSDDDILYQWWLLFSHQCCSSESPVACFLGS
jgi:hypothetical protein